MKGQTTLDTLIRLNFLDWNAQMAASRQIKERKGLMHILRNVVKNPETMKLIMAEIEKRHNFSAIDRQELITRLQSNLDVTRKISLEKIADYRAIPCNQEGGTYAVAFVDPWMEINEIPVYDLVKRELNSLLQVFIITPESFADAINFIRNQTDSRKEQSKEGTSGAHSIFSSLGRSATTNAPATQNQAIGSMPLQQMEPDDETRNNQIMALLQDTTLINPNQLQAALKLQNKNGGKLENILVEQKYTTAEKLYQHFAKKLNIDFVNALHEIRSLESDRLTPEKVLELQAICYNTTPSSTKVLISDPTIMERITREFTTQVIFSLCTPEFWSTIYQDAYPQRRNISVQNAISTIAQISRNVIREVELQEPKMDVIDACLKHRKITEEQAAKVQAMISNMVYVDPVLNPPNKDVRMVINRVTAETHTVFPFNIKNDKLQVLTVKPDWSVSDTIRTSTHREVEFLITTRRAIIQLIETHYVQDQVKRSLERDFANIEATNQQITDLSTDDTSISKLLNTIINASRQRGASDIHIEPGKDRTQVRVRVDGKLYHHDEYSPNVGKALVQKIKLLSQIDIAAKHLPQDGRINMPEISLRVSSVVGVNGEKIVMRILKKGSDIPEIEQLGMQPQVRRLFDQVTAQPQGILLVTGPTGSGKTTTCASLVRSISTPDINIMSVEDPVEYEIQGINQTQVKPESGVTFATLLRAFLRQDPDVIWVGEIRDAETAKIASEAASTGHWVIATMHTNNSVATIQRLRNFMIENYAISEIVRGVLAQRLVRKICPDCSERHDVSWQQLNSAGIPVHSETEHQQLLKRAHISAHQAVQEGLIAHEEDYGKWAYNFRKGTGKDPMGNTCRTCHGEGYRGRIAIHEMLYIDNTIAIAISEGKSVEEITRLARSRGLITLREDGIIKARMGLTTLDEVISSTLSDD